MIQPLPDDAREFMDCTWARIEPYYARLREFELTAQNVSTWLTAWSQLASLLDESYNRLYIATTQNTADPDTQARYNRFVEEIYPLYETAEQTLKEKLIASGLEPEGFAVPLRDLRAQTALFRPENLPLQTQEQKLEQGFDKLLGAETVRWNGEDKTPAQLLPVLQEPDRATRERAWRLIHEKRLENRAALNELWTRMLKVRLQMAKNAGFTLANDAGDYRAYRWQQYHRFDYTPDDCKRFASAIEEVVVPAAAALYDKARNRLGVETLRPWDLQGPQGFFIVNPPSEVEPLHPFQTDAELIEKAATIFYAVDPQLGAYFDTLREEQLLDLANRRNKAPGAYCMNLEFSRRPFIFMNAVGTHEDVQTLLHEAGHAFHAFESFNLPYIHQREEPLEFCEVASMSMEFLGAPYLNRGGSFYADGAAARARIEKIETCIFFWSFMAVVDLFQHWAYENPRNALDTSQCDATWNALWQRFMQGVDWSGLDEECATGWHRKPHIFTTPFYYVEYGMAQLGAAQVWANAQRDPKRAVEQYRRALSLGATVTLPELFRAAGARFEFDAAALRDAVTLMLDTIAHLEQ